MQQNGSGYWLQQLHIKEYFIYGQSQKRSMAENTTLKSKYFFSRLYQQFKERLIGFK